MREHATPEPSLSGAGPGDMYMFKDVHHRSRDAGETPLHRSKVDPLSWKALFVKSSPCDASRFPHLRACMTLRAICVAFTSRTCVSQSYWPLIKPSCFDSQKRSTSLSSICIFFSHVAFPKVCLVCSSFRRSAIEAQGHNMKTWAVLQGLPQSVHDKIPLQDYN